jgi:hypothetical protein
VSENGRAAAGPRPGAEPGHRYSRVLLLTGFLGGPVIWSLHEIVSEFVLAGGCATGPAGFETFKLGGASGWRVLLLVITLIAILAALAVELIAVRAWRQLRDLAAVSGAEGGGAGRSGFLALAGILTSSVFLVGLLFAGAPIFWLSGCT